MPTTIDSSAIHSSPRRVATYTLRKDILTGVLPVGMRLPPEEKLAKKFGISRCTMRFALDDLQNEGLVERRRNFGCVVANRRAGDSLMARTITLISNVANDPQPQLFTGLMVSINSGIIDTAKANQLNCMLVHSDISSPGMAADIIHERPFGVAISTHIGRLTVAGDMVRQLREAGIAAVIQSNDPVFQGVDRVSSDHEQGTAELVHALAAEGRQRILRVWTPPDPEICWWIAAHDRGYDRAIGETALQPIEPLHVPGLLPYDQRSRENFDTRVQQAAGFLLKRHRKDRFDALMVATDSEVPLVAAACRLIGLTPGTDVLICGYDNYWELIAERQWEPTPPFATIDKQNHLIGEEIVRLLMDRAQSGVAVEPQVRLIAPKLVRMAPSPVSPR